MRCNSNRMKKVYRKEVMFCKLTTVFICGILWAALFGQDPGTDSLIFRLKGSEGKARLDLLTELAMRSSKTNPGASLEYAREALNVARELDDPLLLANALNGMAIIYFYLGDQDQSLNFLLPSIEAMKQAYENDTANPELPYRLAVFSSNAGNVYKGKGQFDKALEQFLLAEANLEKLLARDPDNMRILSMLITCLNNKALLLQDLQEKEKAKTILQEALKRSRYLHFQQGIAMCLNNLGLIGIEQGSYQEAMAIYTEALRINQQLNDSIAIAGTYNNLGLISEKSGASQEALTYYQSSLEISQHLKYLFGVANTSVNIGKIFTALHQPDSAERYLVRGLEAAKHGDMIQLQQQSHQYLTELYQMKGQYRKALKSLQEYTAIRDSMYNLERAKLIADMEAKYETEKKERANEILRKEIDLHKTTKQLLVVVDFALVIVVALLVILSRYKSRILKQKTVLYAQELRMQTLEMEKQEIERKHLEDQVFASQEINRLQRTKLDAQNRKLAAFAIQVTAKNQILRDIISELDRVSSSGNQNQEDRYRQIRQTVKENLNLDTEWEQFKLHFEEVHPDFFIRLNETYPNLTPGEQKICAYYRINLDTSEIARILNITPAAVQKSRHRLRKKLGIDSGTDLAAFMLKF